MEKTYTVRWHPPEPADLPPMRRLTRTAARRIGRAFNAMTWRMKHGLMSDVEVFTFRLTTMHAKDGRWDLVEEDLAWLASRIERGVS